MDLLKKENITVEDIQSLIDNGIEESLNIEYKAAGSLHKQNNCTKEVTKDVSAFANSNGGILIYGLKEENQKPTEIDFINGKEYSKDWLEQMINNVHRKIKLEVIPVRLNGELSKTVYVVRIPESTDAPHMAHDGIYYRRMNFQVVKMEEYEVRNLYYRKDYPELESSNTFVIKYNGTTEKSKTEHSFTLTFSVTNKSKIVEDKYKLSVAFKEAHGMSLSWIQDKDYIITPNDLLTVSTTKMPPVFPDETLAVMEITIILRGEKITEVLEVGEMIRTLHHSTGSETITNDFKHIFRKQLLDKNIIDEDNKYIFKNPLFIPSSGKNHSHNTY